MSYSTAIDRLTGKRPTGGRRDGYDPERAIDREQIADIVLPEGVSRDEYLEQTEAAPKGFDPAEYGAKADATLEGFLFPATYELPANEAQRVQTLIKQQLRPSRTTSRRST